MIPGYGYNKGNSSQRIKKGSLDRYLAIWFEWHSNPSFHSNPVTEVPMILVRGLAEIHSPLSARISLFITRCEMSPPPSPAFLFDWYWRLCLRYCWKLCSVPSEWTPYAKRTTIIFNTFSFLYLCFNILLSIINETFDQIFTKKHIILWPGSKRPMSFLGKLAYVNHWTKNYVLFFV